MNLLRFCNEGFYDVYFKPSFDKEVFGVPVSLLGRLSNCFYAFYEYDVLELEIEYKEDPWHFRASCLIEEIDDFFLTLPIRFKNFGKTYEVLEHEYLCDGVYWDKPIYKGSWFKCRRYVENLEMSGYHNPLKIVLQEDY